MHRSVAVLAIAASAQTAFGAVTDRPLSDKACYAAMRQAVRSGQDFYPTWNAATVKQFEQRLADRKGTLPLTQKQSDEIEKLANSILSVERVWQDMAYAVPNMVWFSVANAREEILKPRTRNKESCQKRSLQIVTQTSQIRLQLPRPTAQQLIDGPPSSNAPQQCALKAAAALDHYADSLQHTNPNKLMAELAAQKLRLGGSPLPYFQALVVTSYATAPAGSEGSAEIWAVEAGSNSYALNFKDKCQRQLLQRLSR